jgi:hypothetical protein
VTSGTGGGGLTSGADGAGEAISGGEGRLAGSLGGSGTVTVDSGAVCGGDWVLTKKTAAVMTRATAPAPAVPRSIPVDGENADVGGMAFAGDTGRSWAAGGGGRTCVGGAADGGGGGGGVLAMPGGGGGAPGMAVVGCDRGELQNGQMTVLPNARSGTLVTLPQCPQLSGTNDGICYPFSITGPVVFAS